MTRRVRAVLVFAACVAVAVAVARVRPSAPAAATGPDRLVVLAASWLLWALAGYAATVLGVVAGLTALRCASPPASRRFPRHVIRVAEVLLGAGTVSMALAPAATAVTLQPHHGPSVAPPIAARTAAAAADDPLGWAARRPLRASDIDAAPHHRATTVRVLVRPGDSLWAIAADALGTRDPTAVAIAWPRWYAANARLIGADPGHIVPGQRLVPPPTLPRRS